MDHYMEKQFNNELININNLEQGKTGRPPQPNGMMPGGIPRLFPQKIRNTFPPRKETFQGQGALPCPLLVWVLFSLGGPLPVRQ
jgi:hypothetical protein